jgi:hypothetical protein
LSAAQTDQVELLTGSRVAFNRTATPLLSLYLHQSRWKKSAHLISPRRALPSFRLQDQVLLFGVELSKLALRLLHGSAVDLEQAGGSRDGIVHASLFLLHDKTRNV